MITSLADGDNIYYTVVTSTIDTSISTTYVLTIHKSYSITVSYYNGTSRLFYTIAYTGYSYSAIEDPYIKGYTFNYWKTSDGQAYTDTVLWENLSLYADVTPNIYIVTYNVNGGNELSETTATVAYGSSYTLEVPERNLYTFNGWYYGETQLTDANGKSLSVWSYTEDIILTANWTENQYTVALNISENGAGSISGNGSYVYGENVTIVASQANLGYEWAGWYCDNTLYTENLSFDYTISTEDIEFTAVYNLLDEISNFKFTSTATTCTISGIVDNTVTEIIVPDYVTSISSGSFNGCSSLVSIILPFIGGKSSNTAASESTLFGYIFGTSSYIGGTAIKQYYSSSGYKTYYIPSSLSTVVITGGSEIFYGTFYSCSMIKSITIPESITSFSSYAFRDCTGLTEINYNAVEANDLSSNNYVFYTSLSGSKGITLNVGAKVKHIPAYLFCPSSSSSFDPKITSIVFEENSACTSIGDYAFQYAKSLTSVSVSSIEKWCNLSFGTIESNPMYYANYLYLNGEVITGDIVLSDNISTIPYGTFKNSTITSIIIPNTVLSIGDYAFKNCNLLTEIDVPSSVSTIGNAAFSGCSSLINLSLPFVGGSAEAVTASNATLLGYIFGTTKYSRSTATIQYYESDSYVTYYIPSSLTTVTITGGKILYGAFYNCNSIVSITIPPSVALIGSNAFYNCYKLLEVYNLSSVSITVGSTENGYAGYYALDIHDSENIESGVILQDDYVFYNDDGNYYLVSYVGKNTTLSLPDSINDNNYSVYNYAFYGNVNLQNVSISDGITGIGAYAFYDCTYLATILIGDNVTTINDYAFYGCTSLATVTIGNNVKTIAEYAFGNCTGLSEIYFKATSISGLSTSSNIFNNAGLNSSGITVTISANVTKIPDYLFDGSSRSSTANITGVIFEENSECKSIGQFAFYCCTSLTSIVIPSTITSIGSYAFSGCRKLLDVCNLSTLNITAGSSTYGYVGYYAKTIYNDSDNSNLIYESNCVFYNDNNNIYYLISYVGTVTDVSLPDNINGYSYSIYDYAFYNCKLIKSIIVPNGVSAIGSYAFYGCALLESITLPDGITAIEDYTFYGCSSLVSVTIPDSVISIGDYAFSDCSSLTEATIGDSVTSIGKYAFNECSALTSATFKNTSGWYVTTIENSSSEMNLTVTNSSTVAKYLRSTYYKYYWYRK